MASAEVDLFGDIFALLDSMQEKGQLDNTILARIDSLGTSLAESEEFWLNNKSANPVDAFVFFHAFRNMRFIMNGLRARFISAPEKHDNPKVVDDALLVLPSMFSAYTTVKPMGTQALTAGLRTLVLGKIRAMRNAASRSNMLLERNGLEVDESSIKNQTAHLAETLRELIE